MKHLQIFETETAFDAEKANIESPCIALTEDDGYVHLIYAPTYEYVDLDLPSGLKWAKCNIGARKPEEYGDYYQWGSVTPNTNTPCDWAHAPFNGGASDYDDDYFNAHKSEWFDGNKLKPGYDAVYAATNGAAHMPTKDDFKELSSYTKHEWIEDYEGSGINGWLIRSMTDTDKYIFIPASGLREDSFFNLQGDDGILWSSSQSIDSDKNAWLFDFSWYDYNVNDHHPRFFGFPVRGVRR